MSIKIGNVDKKIGIPNYKRVQLFADTETYIKHPKRNFDYTPRDTLTRELRDAQVIPWMMSVSYRPIIANKRLSQSYITKVYFRPYNRLFEYLEKLYTLKMVPVIYFHNTSYDLRSSLETVFRALDPDINYEIMIKDSNMDFIWGRLHSPKYNFKCEFGDTMQYEKKSLGKIAKEIGMEKGEMPYGMAEIYYNKDKNIVFYIDMNDGKPKNYPLDKCIEYCKNDTEILREYYFMLNKKKEQLTLEALGRKPKKLPNKTIGNHSKYVAVEWLWDNESFDYFKGFRFEINEEEYLMQRISCCGGYTGFNKKLMQYKCAEGEIIGSYDVNSMYPAIMSNNLPAGAFYEEHPGVNCITWVRVKIEEEIEWCEEYSFLSTPPIPNTKTLGQEIILPEEVYTFLKPITKGRMNVIKTVYQVATDCFKRFMEHFYEKRVTNKAILKDPLLDPLKRENLKIVDDQLKKLMNSQYGKLMEKTHLYSVIYKNGMVDVIEREQPYQNLSAGLYIAWMGRLIIYKHIKEITDRGFKFLYADTDSVKFAYPMDRENEVKQIFGEGGQRMGEWKDEGKFNEFITPKRKKYALINYKNPSLSKIAVSGIKDADKLNKNLINNLINDRDKTLYEIRRILSPEVNVKFYGYKTVSTKTNENEQTILTPTTFQTNPQLKKIHAEVRMDDKGNYIFKDLINE